MERKGISAGGNFIIDHVKVVDLWPEEGMLSIILEEERANGGCAYNVLKDLAKLKTGIPLFGIGLVSNDDDGNYILEDLRDHGIDISMMKTMENVKTSYTDVITVKDTGNRTFFHNKGTSKYLDIEHFDLKKISSKILHIGYILLLDTLDSPDEEFGTRMARLLHDAQSHGIKTSVDVVSESSFRFNKIVLPALKYTDYLIFNEIEAGRTTGYEIRMKNGKLNGDNLKRALESLRESGRSELICIHFPEGSYAVFRDGEPLFMPSHKCPEGFIKSTVGAGDAFCAGMLYGLHEGWELERMMRFANAMAAMCLSGTTTSSGMKTLDETIELMETMPLREEKIL